MPQTPQELTGHNCVVHVLPDGRAQDVWSYQKAEHQCEVKVQGNLTINDGSRMRELALAGFSDARQWGRARARQAGSVQADPA